MRSVRLVTHHACSGWPCGRCRLIETALRRALGLTGIPFPEHERGRKQEAYFSKDLVVEVQHECHGPPGPGGGPHARMYVDESEVPVPDSASLEVLERAFMAFVEEGPAAHVAPSGS